MATPESDRQFVIESWEYLYGRPPTASALNHHVGILQRGEMSRSAMLSILERREDEIVPTVTRLFRETLGRAPTPEEIQRYGDMLRNGTRTRKRITEALATSSEGLLRAKQPAPEDTTAKENANAYLRGVLDDYGLGTLGDWAWKQIQEGYTPERIIQNLRETTEYKQRFIGMEQRKAAGLSAISEAEYIAYERTMTQMMRAAGLPATFYDQPDDFANFIGKDVSPAEMQARINDGFLAATQAPAEVRDELQRLYGIDGASLAAYFLDPDRALPLLERQFSAAQVSGAAARSGFGGLSTSEAERLAALGISAEQAQQGFGVLDDSRELFTSLPGENASDIDRGEQIAAMFEGDAEARRLITKRGEERVSQGSGAQSFAVGQGGVTALGTD